MPRWQTFTFQLSIMSKSLAKHISTKDLFKINNRKTRVYIDIRWLWIWNQYFYLGIWNVERTKIIFLLSFQFVTGLNSQNRNELRHIKYYMSIGISNCHNRSFYLTKMKFFTLFQFLARLLTSKHHNRIST